MARLGITLEQVTAVADALVGEGQPPTIRAIRERLGHTGSPNTIHRHFSAWRETHPMARATATALSPGLAGAIATEIERAAAAARVEIELRLVQAQQEATELASAGEALEAEREALIAQVAALTTERDTLAGKVAQQALTLETAQQQISREQQAAEAARIELATALVRTEQQQKTEAAQTAEIERLRPLLETAQKATISAEPNRALARPPASFGGGVIWVNKARLNPPKPKRKVSHNIHTSQKTPKAMAKSDSASANWFMRLRLAKRALRICCS